MWQHPYRCQRTALRSLDSPSNLTWEPETQLRLSALGNKCLSWRSPLTLPEIPDFLTAFLMGMSHFVKSRLGNCKGREVTPVPESVFVLDCVFFHLCGRTYVAAVCGTL